MLTSPECVAHNGPRHALRHFTLTGRGPPKVSKRMHNVALVLDPDLLPQEKTRIVLEPIRTPSLPAWDQRKEPGFGTIARCSCFGRSNNPNAGGMNGYYSPYSLGDRACREYE